MSLIEIRGRRVHVQSVGRGPVVVLIHGLIQSDLSTMYFSLAPHLSGSRRVVMYDLRGHGRSDHAPAGYDLDTLVSDLEDVIDASVPGGDPVDLVGYSYGGTIALRAALERRPRIRRVVAIDSPRPPFERANVSEALAADSDRVLRDLAGFVGDWMGSEVPALMGLEREGRRNDRRIERFRSIRFDSTLVEDLQRERAWPEEELAALSIPTLLVYARDSSFLPAGESLAEHTGDASRFVVLPGDHGFFFTRTAEIAAEIEGFLDG